MHQLEVEQVKREGRRRRRRRTQRSTTQPNISWNLLVLLSQRRTASEVQGGGGDNGFLLHEGLRSKVVDEGQADKQHHCHQSLHLRSTSPETPRIPSLPRATRV